MFRIVIAPDKFKGSLTSFEVCAAIAKGLKAACAGFEIVQLPLADGGDGLLDILRYYTGAEIRKTTVSGPLSEPVSASWLLTKDRGTAFVEMAEASGLLLLDPAQYNCEATSTYGTGQLILEAIRSGAEEIVIGIGGSATNDGGAGMGAAVGYRFFDRDGNSFIPAGGDLIRIARIEPPGIKAFENIRFRVACDVRNPLCGPTGATRVYAPQKGADPAVVETLEAGMLHYAVLLKRDLGIDVRDRKGAGAAGGLGAGCMAFLQAAYEGGMELVMGVSKAAQFIREADLIISGEGRMDKQTLHGKLIAGIAALGRQFNKPVLAICGSLDLSPADWRSMGITAAFSIVNRPMALEEAQRNAAALLEEAAYGIGRLLEVSYTGE
jgi:glycerate 2-kinase